MSVPPHSPHVSSGRLSTLAAALVVARRDFHAVLFSRSFLAFLIGPLFMLAVSALASSVGQQVEQNAGRPRLGVAMAPANTAAMTAAAKRIDAELDRLLPELVPLRSRPGRSKRRGISARGLRRARERHRWRASTSSKTPT